MSKKNGNILAIIVMFALFFMIAFVTNFAGSMGVIVTKQFGATKAMSQLGTLANFIAYACMGIPAGIILKRRGYKFTALAAVIVDFRLCRIIRSLCGRRIHRRILNVYAQHRCQSYAQHSRRRRKCRQPSHSAWRFLQLHRWYNSSYSPGLSRRR